MVVFKAEPVAEVAPLMVLHDYSCRRVDVVVGHIVDVAFHRFVVLGKDKGVGSHLIALPRNGYAGTSPKQSAESAAHRHNFLIFSRRTLCVAHRPEVAAQKRI